LSGAPESATALTESPLRELSCLTLLFSY
jgi:hypothetical protein